MKKKILLASMMLAFTKATYAAGGSIFGDWFSSLGEEIKDNFVYIAAVVFLVLCLFNLGHFFGETRDYKKGITNIILFVAGLLISIGAYTYIESLSL